MARWWAGKHRDGQGMAGDGRGNLLKKKHQKHPVSSIFGGVHPVSRIFGGFNCLTPHVFFDVWWFFQGLNPIDWCFLGWFWPPILQSSCFHRYLLALSGSEVMLVWKATHWWPGPQMSGRPHLRMYIDTDKIRFGRVDSHHTMSKQVQKICATALKAASKTRSCH